LPGINRKQDTCRGNGQERSSHEDSAITKSVTGVCDQQRAEHIPGRIGCLIPPKLLVKGSGSNYPEGDRRNRRAEKSYPTADQQLCGIYVREADTSHQQKSTRNQDAEIHREQSPLAMHSVDDCTRRGLQRDSN
jgi:hypothetical protein